MSGGCTPQTPCLPGGDPLEPPLIFYLGVLRRPGRGPVPSGGTLRGLSGGISPHTPLVLFNLLVVLCPRFARRVVLRRFIVVYVLVGLSFLESSSEVTTPLNPPNEPKQNPGDFQGVVKWAFLCLLKRIFERFYFQCSFWPSVTLKICPILLPWILGG